MHFQIHKCANSCSCLICSPCILRICPPHSYLRPLPLWTMLTLLWQRGCQRYQLKIVRELGIRGWMPAFVLGQINPQLQLHSVPSAKDSATSQTQKRPVLNLTSKLQKVTWVLLGEKLKKCDIKLIHFYLILIPYVCKNSLCYFLCCLDPVQKVQSIFISHNFHLRKEYDPHHLKPPPASLDGVTRNYYKRCVFFLRLMLH